MNILDATRLTALPSRTTVLSYNDELWNKLYVGAIFTKYSKNFKVVARSLRPDLTDGESEYFEIEYVQVSL